MHRALIIGGSRGLGLGLVAEHLARGWSATATMRSKAPALESLRDGAAGRLTIERCDITRPDEVGPTAPLDIETSVKGVADVLAKRAGTGGTAFVDYRNTVIPW